MRDAPGYFFGMRESAVCQEKEEEKIGENGGSGYASTGNPPFPPFLAASAGAVAATKVGEQSWLASGGLRLVVDNGRRSVPIAPSAPPPSISGQTPTTTTKSKRKSKQASGLPRRRKRRGASVADFLCAQRSENKFPPLLFSTLLT